MSQYSRFFVLCAVALALCTVGCTSRQMRSPNHAAITLLQCAEADNDARAQAVASILSLSAEDKQRLLESVDQRSGAFGEHSSYIFQVLIKYADAAIVKGLGELLVETDYRYYAVALGIIGDTAAIPYLRTALRGSSHNYVRDNCRQALRIIGDRSSLAHLPDPTHLHYPIRPSIHADATQLSLGDQVTLTLTYQNISKTESAMIYPPWINPFHAISLQGDHVERLPGATFFYEITADSFRRLDPGQKYQLSQTFELVVQPIRVDKWTAFENKAFDMLCLKRIDDGGGWEIARFVEGQPSTLHIAAIHRPAEYRTFVDEFGIQDYDEKPLITSAVVIECVPSKTETTVSD